MTVMTLALLAAVFGAWLVWRMFLPLEINYNEAWNGWLAQAAMGRGPLYPDADALTVNNYPPLSFYIVGALAQVLHLSPVFVGRVGSLLGLAATSGAAAAIIAVLGGSRIAAALGGIWCLATIERVCQRQAALDEPTLLALAVMAWALVWLLVCSRRGKRADAAILMMVVAGFIKHNLIAIPVASLAWLWIGEDRRLAARLTLVGGLGAGAGLATCTMIYGQAFLTQIFLFSRVISPARVFTELFKPLALAVALYVGLTWAWRCRRGAASARFVLTFTVVALAVFIIERAGDGVDCNAMFELVLAAAVGLGLGVERMEGGWLARKLGLPRARLIVLAALLAPLLATPDMRPYLLIVSPDYRAAALSASRAADAEVARVRAIPGKVYCTTTIVCFWAGKAFVYDPWAMGQRVATGRWSRERLDRALALAAIKTEIISQDFPMH